LTDLAHAPRQADEGAPDACLVIDADFTVALEGLKAGDEVIVITWLDRAQRDILRTHPRGDAENRAPARWGRGGSRG
jgi:tRNA (Thr-GGU) A37 N-methylase